jgi:hypothetical protein
LFLVVLAAAGAAAAQVQGTATAGPPPPTIVQVQGQAVTAESRPRPVIERIEPTSGPGGTVVTIVGRNFSAADTVFYAGGALPLQSVVPTRITVVVPQGARSGRFTVQGPGGTAESSQTFNVVQPPPPPTVAGFSPPSGPVGTDVALSGTGFSLRIYENRVSLNGLVLPVRTASTTQLTVTIPEGAADGPFVVSVANAGEARSASSFDVLAPLRIDRLEPPAGAVGTVVRILGSGFGEALDANSVRLGDRRCTVRSASGTEIAVEVPARAQTGAFVVSVRDRGELVSPEFRVVYPPALRSVSPPAGFPGTEVTLSGANFGTALDAVQANMSGVALPVVGVTPSEVRVRIPENAGTGVIQLTVRDAGTVVTPSAFEVWVAPAITSFRPPRGGPGTTVTVAGRGFLAGRGLTTVSVGGVTAAVASVTASEVVFTVPGGAVTGRLLVGVRDRGEARSATDFVVLAPPRITELTPAGAAPGADLSIIGENFGSSIADVTVTFGDPAQPVDIRSLSPTQIVVAAPGGSSGRFRVTVRGIGEAQSATYRPGRPSGAAIPR